MRVTRNQAAKLLQKGATGCVFCHDSLGNCLPHTIPWCQYSHDFTVLPSGNWQNCIKFLQECFKLLISYFLTILCYFDVIFKLAIHIVSTSRCSGTGAFCAIRSVCVPALVILSIQHWHLAKLGFTVKIHYLPETTNN